jgi:hypothetical protein
MRMDTGLQESSFEKPGPGKNVSYRMWTLKEKNKPSESEALRLLVRSSTHAVQIDRRAGCNPFQVCDVEFGVTDSFGGKTHGKHLVRGNSEP